MKLYLFLVVLFIFVLAGFAQNKSASEHRPAVAKSEAGWNKAESENAPTSNAQTIAEGIVFSTNSGGIYITLPKAVGNVKLFSLTGEVVWTGNLVQGRFYIPTRAGIYFLKVNNKSYKVVCK
jgi:hypothetical protein